MTLRNGRRPYATCIAALACLPLLVSLGVTRAEAQTRAYVAHKAANVVFAIDTATGTVVATIPVGSGPTRVAIAGDGTRAYVTNAESDSISVIDTGADAVVATIPVGDSPSYLGHARRRRAVRHDGGRDSPGRRHDTSHRDGNRRGREQRRDRDHP